MVYYGAVYVNCVGGCRAGPIIGGKFIRRKVYAINSGMKNGIEVSFYQEAQGLDLIYAVIIARHEGKWVLCRHRDRQTLEVPGGHIEEGESPMQAAGRELYEETGATRSRLTFICEYSVKRPDGAGAMGALFFAEIEELGPLPESEIAQVFLLDEFPGPERLTYPEIQPLLMKHVMKDVDKAQI
ncbi:MAG: NUDIX hydrolase [Christensenellales bacterium]|jgi:8-oxo-dGTP diphosphatase